MVKVIHAEVIGDNVEIGFSDGTRALVSAELLLNVLKGDYALHGDPEELFKGSMLYPGLS